MSTHQQALDYVKRVGLNEARVSNHYLTAKRHCSCGICFCCEVKRVVDGAVMNPHRSASVIERRRTCP